LILKQTLNLNVKTSVLTLTLQSTRYLVHLCLCHLLIKSIGLQQPHSKRLNGFHYFNRIILSSMFRTKD